MKNCRAYKIQKSILTLKFSAGYFMWLSHLGIGHLQNYTELCFSQRNEGKKLISDTNWGPKCPFLLHCFALHNSGKMQDRSVLQRTEVTFFLCKNRSVLFLIFRTQECPFPKKKKGKKGDLKKIPLQKEKKRRGKRVL